MKKIALVVTLIPTDDAITAEQVVEAMSHLGKVSVFAKDEIQLATADNPALTKEVVIYASSDDSEPFLLVEGESDEEGRELEENEVAKLSYFGVCTAFFAKYPRARIYGAPLFATGIEGFAEAKVAGHNFVVASEGMEISAEDSRDDTPEKYWFTLSIPADLHAELAA